MRNPGRSVARILALVLLALGGVLGNPTTPSAFGADCVSFLRLDADISPSVVAPGQVASTTARSYFDQTGDTCQPPSETVDWSFKLWLSNCGYLPPLASGTTTITATDPPGKIIFAKALAIPKVCPPGSQYDVGKRVQGGDFGNLFVRFDVVGPSYPTGGAAFDNGTVVSFPSTVYPSGYRVGGQSVLGMQGDPVNSLTGAFTHADEDFSMPVRGGSLDVWRSYDSGLTRRGPLGAGWTSSFSDSLVVEPGEQVTWRTSQGASVEFRHSSGTTWRPPFGNSARLTERPDGTFTVRTEDLWSLRFTRAGLLTRAADRSGRAYEVTRDGSGRVAMVSSSGRALKYVYDASTGLLDSVTALGSEAGEPSAVTDYAYADGRLAKVTKPGGEEILYGYDAGGRLSSIRNSSTSVPQVQLTYGSDGRVATQKDGDGNVSRFGWDAASSIATMTDPRGGRWKDVYANGWLVEQTDPTGVTTTFDWTSKGQLFRVSGPGGQETVFDYDAELRRTSRTDARGGVETTDYAGSFREPAADVDVANRTTTFGYDSNRNLTKVTPPLPTAATSMSYDPSTFDLETFTDPTQKVWSYDYAADSGDLISRTSPLGNKTTYAYDGFGRTTRVTPPQGNVAGASGSWSTTYSRDAAGRVLRVAGPSGIKAKFTYDSFGRVATRTDGRGGRTTYHYDNSGHLTQLTLPDGSTESFAYDANGNVRMNTDGRGQVTAFGYDAANRLTSVTRGNRAWSFTYDSAGRRRTASMPTGRKATFTWDIRSLLTKVDYSDATPDVSFAYDKLGRRKSMTDGTGTTTYKYDSLDRPTTVLRGTDTWKYAWDDNGRLASRTAPGQTAVTYTYDPDGRLRQVKRGATVIAQYAYDTAKNSITRTTANGMDTIERFSRDGFLASTRTRNPAGTTLRLTSYTRDIEGNPIKVADKSGVVRTQLFDSRNRLTAVCYETSSCDGATDYIRYGYDANGNIVSEQRPAGTVRRTYDAYDQLATQTQSGATTEFQYDADGNRSVEGGTKFDVNAAGQITRSTNRRGVTTTYKYNGNGQLVSTTRNGTSTKYDYDPMSAQLVGMRRGSRVTHAFIYGREVVATVSGAETSFHTTDDIGSIVQTRNATRNVLKSYDYQPYGSARSITGSGPTSPIRYTGAPNLGTGGYQMGVRQYRPGSATFATPDQGGTGDAYEYASGNPALYTDPLGLYSWDNFLQDVNTVSGYVATGASVVAVGCTSIVICAPAAPVAGGIAVTATAVNAASGVAIAATNCSKGSCAGDVVLSASMAFGSRYGAGKLISRAAANAGDDFTRVGRWMGDDELLKMQKSGQVQVGGGGTTHVADPANMSTYAKQAASGSKYVEFDVPRTSLFPSGWPGGAQIPGPNHILARLAERRGSPVQFPVPACNIVVVGSC